MATLERIRNRAGILVAAFIGLALLAFILNDLLGSGQKVFGGGNQRVAKVDGESISIQEYQNQIAEFEDYAKLSSGRSSLDETTSQRLREQVWNQLVQKIVMDKKYAEIGIEVTPDEILDMVAGKNIDGIPVAPVKFLQDRPVVQGNDVAFNPYRSRGEMIDNEGNARNRRDDSHAQGHDFSPNVRGL